MVRSLIITLAVLCSYSNSLFGQYEVKVMQYNLLNYGNNFGSCSDYNNSITYKNSKLKTIFAHVKPDIITVNEIAYSPDGRYVNSILDNALNVDGVDYYKTSDKIKGNASIGNAVFFNSKKIGFADQDIITTEPRITDVYKLYYKTPDLGVTEDTVFIYCFVAHLKAGRDDTERRRNAAKSIMIYRKYKQQDNCLMMGDFNLYTNQEPAYKMFTDYEIEDLNFNDPVNAEGAWSNNSNYKKYHTQSTHSRSDCAVGGGMDDRFDFILISNNLLKDDYLKYKSGSYKAIGQDGSFFNRSILESNNSNMPSSVINALYNCSDHLPVYLELTVKPKPLTDTGGTTDINSSFKQSIINIYQPDDNTLNINTDINDSYTLRIVDATGREILFKRTKNSAEKINISNFDKGIYIVNILSKNRSFSKQIAIK